MLLLCVALGFVLSFVASLLGVRGFHRSMTDGELNSQG